MTHADEPLSEVDVLLQQARAGNVSARGRLLESYRDHLEVMARSLLDQSLRSRVTSSDLVQDTLLEAHRDFGHFVGKGERGLASWLHKILMRNLADQADFHHAGRRDVRRDRSLDGEPENSAPTLGDTLASPISSPSTQAMRREEADALAEALERLPADYRAVFLLRNLEGVAFEEIASRMGRSPSAVRMLWERALVKLSQTLERPP